MYLTLDQVVLVQNKRNARPDDPVICAATTQIALNDLPAGSRVLVLAASIPGVQDGRYQRVLEDVRPYGHTYIDSGGRICIVPDVWHEEDAWQAALAIGENG